MKRATESDQMILAYARISIHALVKRATRCAFVPLSVHDISIHALVKRATPEGRLCFRCVRNFNPRPREEGDASTAKPFIYSDNFNPRSREEGD